MSLNFSSHSDGILHLSNNSSITTYLPFSHCFIYRPSSFIFASYFITNILVLLPLCIYIISLGVQQWWKQNTTSTAAMMSHSDFFTYNMVIMELMSVVGHVICCCGIFMLHVNVFFVGFILWGLIWYGEIFFQVLTCLERYLAVVHPITYRNLRSQRGIRIRNICIGCVWLLSAGGSSSMAIKDLIPKLQVFILFSSLIIICFCSLAVLCALIRPGPGEQEQTRERDRVDQSKRRAYYTILAILGVVSLRFVQNISWPIQLMLGTLDCMSSSYGVWCGFPCSLVLPLLFLHRVGKVSCCRSNK